MKVGAASTAVLAVRAAAAAKRPNFLVSRMEVSPSLLWLYAEVHSRRCPSRQATGTVVRRAQRRGVQRRTSTAAAAVGWQPMRGNTGGRVRGAWQFMG